MSARPANRFDLFTCGWKGHVLVGTDAGEIADADAALVREVGDVRFHHCLRCHDWVLLAPPTAPTRPTVPARSEIELPLRGPLLRDRYVLRLIAVERAVHVVVLAVLAVLLFLLAGNHSALQRDYTDIVDAFGGPSQAHPLLGRFQSLLTISTAHLYEAGAVVVAYGALEATEMVGLWFTRRWAEYLTFVATVLLVPFEIYELASSVSALKLVVFVVNVAIAAYLLWSKRLFGVHGGQRAEDERLRSAVSWESLEASVPPPAAAGDPLSPDGG
jgi:uncharacterized membrane protein (DUF2068 family)